MAKSGSFGNTFTTGYRIQIDWSATQDTAGNKSTITCRLYLMSMTSYHNISSSQAKSLSISIAGSSNGDTANVSLSPGQKKLLHSWSRTVSHDSNGKLKAALSAWVDLELNLGGSRVNRVSTSQTVTLNDIPRESSLSSNANWTAGSDKAISISRASSGFTHTLKFYVDGTLIKTVTGVGASTTVKFNKDENTKIFRELAQGTSKSTRIELTTYSGSTNVGTKSYTGTVTAPDSSTLSIGSSFNIGANISGSLSRRDSEFTHDIRMVVGGDTYNVGDAVGTSFSYDTSAIASELYAKTPNSNTLSAEVRVYTNYNGIQVRARRDYDISLKVTGSNPTAPTDFSYEDTVAAMIAITGNNQFIIQSQSNVKVTIPADNRALPKNAATMKRYEMTLNGVTATRDWSSTGDVTYTFEKVDASKDVNLTIKSIDSRGNSSSTSKIVKMIPYTVPSIAPAATRLNGFENKTSLALTGKISPLTINGVNKNALTGTTAVQYRYKRKDATGWGSWTNFPYSSTGTNYVGTAQELVLSNVYAWDIEVKTVDKLGTNTVAISVPVGKPIFFIDSVMKALGFNDFPVNPNEFRINGSLVFGQNQWSTSDFGGALNLNNSDIRGANAMWFFDPSNAWDEGLNWLRTGVANGTANPEDRATYDNLKVLDGALKINNNIVGIDHSKSDPLWTGAMFMTATHIVEPTIPLNKTPNGWMLVWSDADPGSNGNPTTINDFNWAFSPVPKEAGGYPNSMFFSVPVGSTTGTQAANDALKSLYITNTQIKGHADNGTSPSNDLVLRYVLYY